MEMISLNAAMELTGHNTRQTLYQWVERHNGKYPQHMILRRHGKIDRVTLLKAIERLSRPAAMRDQQ